jgi:S-adenosylmethionine/arginine decarboxylase-like enzyme
MVKEKDKPYGFELIMDLHGCDVSTFNRKSLKLFLKMLCDEINMTRCKLHFWDDIGVPLEEQQTSPHTKGTSAVQFILTSTIVIHTLDLLNAVYINIFSCKEFDKDKAEKLTREWFNAKECRAHFIERI